MYEHATITHIAENEQQKHKHDMQEFCLSYKLLFLKKFTRTTKPEVYKPLKRNDTLTQKSEKLLFLVWHCTVLSLRFSTLQVYPLPAIHVLSSFTLVVCSSHNFLCVFSTKLLLPSCPIYVLREITNIPNSSNQCQLISLIIATTLSQQCGVWIRLYQI